MSALRARAPGWARSDILLPLFAGDDPVLAWVTLAGEITLFDQIDNPGALPPTYAAELKQFAQKSIFGSGRRFWQALEAEHWKDFAAKLRALDVIRGPARLFPSKPATL